MVGLNGSNMLSCASLGLGHIYIYILLNYMLPCGNKNLMKISIIQSWITTWHACLGDLG